MSENRRYYRSDIDDNLDRVMNAMRFYMHLHAWKGSVYDSTPAQDLEGVKRNYREFLAAIAHDDEREILAEGIGMINHAWFVIAKLADDELGGVQEWEDLLDRVPHDTPA